MEKTFVNLSSNTDEKEKEKKNVTKFFALHAMCLIKQKVLQDF